ncbi:MAG: HAD-IIIA family hydrolase [Phycisphaerales bacterium]|nr:HAD-IIIA family hydrolase [Phycisphaerales bacterium]
MTAAVFLDRDDTLIDSSGVTWRPGERPGDLADPARVRLLPGAREGCGILKAAGFTLVVITNQGLVARAGGTLDDVEAVHDRLRELMIDDTPDSLGGTLIDAAYYCPFYPQGAVPRFAREHDWRKPAPGMIRAAARDLDLNLAESWMIGDAPRDLESALAAGIAPQRCLLLKRDVPDLLGAALTILARRAASGAESVARLAAGFGEPLRDPRVRETVLAAARAIAERTGVTLLDLRATETMVEARLAGSRVAALGFAAELRRHTNRWHEARYGAPLWPDEARP